MKPHTILIALKTRIAAFVALLALSCSPSAPAPEAAAICALAILGQSNAMGQGVTPPAVVDPTNILYYVRIGVDQTGAVLPFGPVNGLHGVEMALAPGVRDAGFQVGVLKDASTGGTTIAEWVDSGSPTMWPGLVTGIQTFTDLIRARNGPDPIVWHVPFIQGEADANSAPPNPAAYSTPLRALVAQLRALLGANMQFYVVALNPDSGWPDEGKAFVRAAQQSVGKDKGVTYIETAGIPLGPDHIHYTSSGYNAIAVLLEIAILSGAHE